MASEEHDSDDDDVESLEEEVESAMIERLPQLKGFLVRPYSIEHENEEMWVVAQCSDLGCYISIEGDAFGVGWSVDDLELTDASLYPTAELATEAFLRAAQARPKGH
jgi:hypothetical protein